MFSHVSGLHDKTQSKTHGSSVIPLPILIRIRLSSLYNSQSISVLQESDSGCFVYAERGTITLTLQSSEAYSN